MAPLRLLLILFVCAYYQVSGAAEKVKREVEHAMRRGNLSFLPYLLMKLVLS